ncbi:MAG TPA: prolyl oligopeptidase family serine peptidase, partial [Acetobacteraceae bacterium]|nr:prolyl oligopeptidase family serine peptidase [Acetobacteraceae bacterium]
MRLAAICLLAALAAPAARAATVAHPDAEDPFLWLEDAHGARAMTWVKQQDAKSLAVLQADPHYQAFYQQALALTQAPDRIPLPQQLNGGIFNFWQDANHIRGIWRRTTLDSYRTQSPAWETVLDVDALAKAEHANWVYKGADCLEPGEYLCLISLSDGGEDAVTEREFDVRYHAFRPGGFALPRAKISVDWENENSLLVATDWGPGSMTASSYPYIVKRLHRGQALADAQEVFRGTPQDEGVNVIALTDGAGHHIVVLQEELDFFRSAWFRVTPTGTERLALPEKMEPLGLVDGRLAMKLDQAWTPPGGSEIPTGSIASLDLFTPGATPEIVFAPGPRQSVDEAAVTRDQIVASIYDNVRGSIVAFAPHGKTWQATRLALPDNVATAVESTELASNQAFLGVTGFLTPSSIWLADLASGAPPEKVKQSPARFDAASEVVEQFQATSTDGTKIPYFVVRPKDMKNDGSNPTLLYAYGGFAISMVPFYSPVIGKLWLEHGGVYVLANIRGGGEFGPAWHEAALKTNRQKAYDDFAAVAKDLIARGITSPQHLGIEGGSNGGLLMGVEFTQHPDLWHAVVIEVPLLDMLRYEKIAAGASWVGEYGSDSDPAVRAFWERTSPYANLHADVKYPEPFIYTTTKDDRVGP